MKERRLSRQCRHEMPGSVWVHLGGKTRRSFAWRLLQNAGRAVKAGRRPPEGEALTARSVVVHIM